LTLTHAILSHLLARADAIVAASGAEPEPKPFVLDEESSEDAIARRCAYGLVTGFTGLVLPLYRELELRVDSREGSSLARDRMRLLVAQVREMARLAVRELARGIRYLPAAPFLPVQRQILGDYAQFALEDAEAGSVVEPERVRDLQT
jgi:hypothetical protein